jgi:hypothetical protein
VGDSALHSDVMVLQNLSGNQRRSDETHEARTAGMALARKIVPYLAYPISISGSF